MPWCETPGCGKQNLGPNEIVFDEAAKLVRCHECSAKAQAEYSANPGKLQYMVAFSSTDGLIAKASVQGLNFSFHAPTEAIYGVFATKKPAEILPHG